MPPKVATVTSPARTPSATRRRSLGPDPAGDPPAGPHLNVYAYLSGRVKIIRNLYGGRSYRTHMADFLAVVGIIIFALAMLGLVWALERV
jgi:hypothetical protein